MAYNRAKTRMLFICQSYENLIFITAFYRCLIKIRTEMLVKFFIGVRWSDDLPWFRAGSDTFTEHRGRTWRITVLPEGIDVPLSR